MSITRPLYPLVVLLLLAARVSAQESLSINLATTPDRVSFITPGAALEWRLEVANAQGETVVDSGFVKGTELDWPLVDAKGQPIDGGVYTYTLTIRDRGSAPRVQRGQLQIERVHSVYQVNALTGDSIGSITLTTADVSLPPASAPPVTSPSNSFRRSLGAVTFVQPLISGSGTTNTMTKWLDGPSGLVGDANVTEVNGNVVIGNGTFKGNLHIYGTATNDVFAGMGPNLISGPAFNYGYAGSTFGRSAGFFNVRPDPSATAPNPSLRFMTENVERMIIDRDGNVGIGTSFPSPTRLNVVANAATGIYSASVSGIGVYGVSSSNSGVYGSSTNGSGVTGFSTNLSGVGGSSTNGTGVYGNSGSGVGVIAASASGNLMEGYTGGTRKFHITNSGSYVAGSDFAEALPRRDGDHYEPGDVLVASVQTLGVVERASRPYDPRVVGVYSTRPGLLGADKAGVSRVDPDDVPVAIVGIVPTKVSTENGPVQIGDLLTTSSTPGHAMKVSRNHVATFEAVGTVLGKALEPLHEGRGVIKVLVTLK